MLENKRVLLIIAGGIAAYKSLDLIRRLRDRGASVRAVLTAGGAHFVTPLSVSALTEDKVYQDLFSLTDESEMGHIRLSREADIVVVAPATADLIARMAAGMADDLATTLLLATDKPVLIAPSMNVEMWRHAATRANIATLAARGIHQVGPSSGDLACGEVGAGRLAEVPEIIAAIERVLAPGPLKGIRALVTAGPTFEPIDPVRFIGNRSSGKQGYAIAAAFARAGAETTLVSGSTALDAPAGVTRVAIETAREMLAACEASLARPGGVDVAVCAAAVADWRVEAAPQKLKKGAGGPPTLSFAENPDILATIAGARNLRPRLVVGFAAETEKLIEHATAKRRSKGCDWILANDVSPERGVFGGDQTTIHLITEEGAEAWPLLDKTAVAERLVARVARTFNPIQ